MKLLINSQKSEQKEKINKNENSNENLIKEKILETSNKFLFRKSDMLLFL